MPKTWLSSVDQPAAVVNGLTIRNRAADVGAGGESGRNVTSGLKRIAIVGAGPIGLEAALLAAQRGFDVQVYERGRVARNVGCWGHVKLFSPFGMNISQRGRSALNDAAGGEPLPKNDALLTGAEFVRRYLLPLSRLPVLEGRIHEHVAVEAIGRSRTWKGELIGRPERAADPFQLLLRDRDGQRTAEADFVLDCTGTFGNHNWVGAGGMPCVGERDVLSNADYQLPDILGIDRQRFANRKTLVVGSGYSAATAVRALADLAESEPSTRAVWITRTGRTPPIAPIPEDSLTERAQLCTAANQLAAADDGPVEWKPSRLIRKIARSGDGALTVWLESRGVDFAGKRSEILTVDRIIANVGYRPDRGLYEELQVHECYASQSPMKLAAALLGETSVDCTAQLSHGADVLRNPEPGLFILGSKSYGRDSRFLIRIGLEQIEDVFSLVAVSKLGCG